MKIKFHKNGKLFAKADIEPPRIASASVVQIGDDFFTFSRMDGTNVEFDSGNLLVLDDEEVQFAGE